MLILESSSDWIIIRLDNPGRLYLNSEFEIPSYAFSDFIIDYWATFFDILEFLSKSLVENDDY